MPFTPTKLAERTVRVDFSFDGEPVFVEYRPGALNDDAIADMQRIYADIQRLGASVTPDGDDSDLKAEAEAKSLEFAQWISRVVAAWDFCEDADAEGNPGAMVPLTPERIAAEVSRFPDFVAACGMVAMQDFQDIKAHVGATSGRSAGTSSRTALSTSSRK